MWYSENKAQHSKTVSIFFGIVYIITHERANRTKYFGLFECHLVTKRSPMVSWRLSANVICKRSKNVQKTLHYNVLGTLSANVIRVICKHSPNVLTLFFWVGTYWSRQPKVFRRLTLLLYKLMQFMQLLCSGGKYISCNDFERIILPTNTLFISFNRNRCWYSHPTKQVTSP